MPWEQVTRDEMMQRAILDSSVNSAMATHTESLGDIDRRVIGEIARLAVHTALTQYAAQIKMEIARIESFERMRYEESRFMPQPPIGKVLR